VIKEYYQIAGGDTLKIRDSTRMEIHSRNELLSNLEAIDSALSKVDSTLFRIGNTEYRIKVQGVFKIEKDSTISLKAYSGTISDKKTTNDYFGIYVGDIGTRHCPIKCVSVASK
jgi:hypothetical protein